MAFPSPPSTTVPLSSNFSGSQQPLGVEPPPLPPQLRISKIVTLAELSQFRRINSLLLPIRYPDSFYNDILSSPIINALTLIATYIDPKTPASPTVVGGIRCRLEPVPPDGNPQDHEQPETQRQRLYILTLAILSPYRNLGLATHLLKKLISNALSTSLTNDPPVIELYAHVWEANEDARMWYGKRGFREDGGVVQGYYRRLKPGGAVVVRRMIGVRDWLDAAAREDTENVISSEVESEQLERNGTDIIK